MNIQCPHCSQRYTIPEADIGGTASCQACGKDFVIAPAEPPEPPPAPEAPSPEPTVPCPYCGEHILAAAKKCRHCGEFLDVSLRKENEERKTRPSNNPINQVMSFVRWFTALPRLSGFQFSVLFVSTFKHHQKEELDALFCSGGVETTPVIEDVSSAWPKPWVCWRFLFFGLIVIGAFILGFEKYENLNMFPGIMIVGAFTMPLTILLFFYETNVLRNISFYKIVSYLIIGGIVSLILTLAIHDTWIGNNLDSFLGAMSAGITEEISKLIVAIILIFRIAGPKRTLQGMLIGAAIGAGFAGFETAGYGLCKALEAKDVDSFYRLMGLRAVFAPFGHVVWTALSAGALYGEIGNNPFSISIIFRWNVLRILFFSVTLHMLWNSGLNWGGDINILIYGWLLSIVGSWQAVLMMLQKGLNEIREAQNV